jgi:hypothetical protein
VALLPPAGSNQLTQLGATTSLDQFVLTGAVREVYATAELRWGDGDNTSVLIFWHEFCEHLASADQPVIQSGRIATTDGQLAQAWVVDNGYPPYRIAVATCIASRKSLVSFLSPEAPPCSICRTSSSRSMSSRVACTP